MNRLKVLLQVWGWTVRIYIGVIGLRFWRMSAAAATHIGQRLHTLLMSILIGHNQRPPCDAVFTRQQWKVNQSQIAFLESPRARHSSCAGTSGFLSLLGLTRYHQIIKNQNKLRSFEPSNRYSRLYLFLIHFISRLNYCYCKRYVCLIIMTCHNMLSQIKQMNTFHSLEVVARGSESQLQLGENLNNLI